jgi:hypothetical protein
MYAMNRLIILISLITAIALFVPATTALAFSVHDQFGGHMMHQDAAVHDNMGHMNNQCDMVHHTEETVVSPKTDAEQIQPTAKPEPEDLQSIKKIGFQGHKIRKSPFHTRSLP